ncbi:MAG TPA: serine/threonine-protein kinase [Thermoanaerobaculia bacterium]|jgi:serine/threonine-protein kinase|nr:serine/threonine-protein kinase [Thermoanaerobaculia bacterium]
MTEAERFHRLRAIFDVVAETPPGDRQRALEELCRGEPDLRSEAEALLAAEAQASAFLAGLSQAAGAALPSVLGRQLGPYRIERKLGEGGMSTVYVAVRTDLAYQQQVAIKIFGFSPDRADLLLRFQSERQILASLRHPAIARLLDGGATEEGLPYLVMELIEGVPVDQFCEEHGLATGERIDLFLRICEAVAYAHRNLVVHRDLKPANILVDAEGAPKLLDFGIAKLLAGAPWPLGPQETQTGQRLMTPQYASPEQVTGGPITTATDVYALGVLLYVLLTGRLPYRAAERPGELERVIAERPPEPPSQVAPPPLRRALKGDLDNIVLTALRKEAQQRYPAVDSLAEDLRRHRQGLPVSALPATLGYRLRKFVGRYPLAVAAWSAAFLLILGLAISMTFQSVRLRRERDRAVQVTGFLEDVFKSSDAEQARGREVTARELLDRGGTKVLAELKGQPETEAALALTIGKAYRSLGLYDSAAPLLERSLALRRQRLGETHPDVAECLDNLADLYLRRDEISRAEQAARRALAIRRERGGESDPAILESLNGLGMVLLTKADFTGAEPLFREALKIDRKHFGRAHKESVPILANLAVLEKQKGDLAAAEGLYREALTIARSQYGPAHPWTSILLGNLAVLLTRRGDLAAAEATYREALAVAHRAYGAEHPSIALQLNNLASVLVDRDRWAEAESLYRQALAMQRKFLGNDRVHVSVTLNNLADLLAMKGDRKAARPLYEESLRIVRKLYGDEHPRVADQLANLAAFLVGERDYRAAEPLAQEALAIRRKVFGETHASYAASLVTLGDLRLAEGSPAAAEPLLRQGLAILRQRLPANHQDTAAAESQLGSCLAALGRSAEAEPLLVSGYQTLKSTLGPAHPRTAVAMRRLNDFHESTGKAGRPIQPAQTGR